MLMFTFIKLISLKPIYLTVFNFSKKLAMTQNLQYLLLLLNTVYLANGNNIIKIK